MNLQNLPGVGSRSGAKEESIYSIWLKVAAANLKESFGHQGYHLNVGEIPKHNRVRSIGMTLLYGDDFGPLGGVTLSDGGRLKDAVIRCHVIPRTAEEGSAVPVGTLRYLPAYRDTDPAPDYNYSHSSHIHIELRIPERQFDDLVTHFHTGRLPSSLSVDLRGLSLPTEFEYHWDVKEFSQLPIINFAVEFVVAVDYTISREDKPFKQTLEPSYYPPTRADFISLYQMIKIQSEQTQYLVVRMTWATIALLAIVSGLGSYILHFKAF